LPQMRFWTFGQFWTFWTFWTVKTSFGHCPVQNPIGRPKRNPENLQTLSLPLSKLSLLDGHG
jgi:hypothetical protein